MELVSGVVKALSVLAVVVVVVVFASVGLVGQSLGKNAAPMFSAREPKMAKSYPVHAHGSIK